VVIILFGSPGGSRELFSFIADILTIEHFFTLLHCSSPSNERIFLVVVIVVVAVKAFVEMIMVVFVSQKLR
jgi:hypothetical protein